MCFKSGETIVIQNVISSLTQLNTLHEELLDLAQQKQLVLIQNEVKELTMITNKESKLMKQVSEREQKWLI